MCRKDGVDKSPLLERTPRFHLSSLFTSQLFSFKLIIGTCDHINSDLQCLMLLVYVIIKQLIVTCGFLQGHELTLRILYKLFGEAEVGRDFFSSTTATSVYELFLLTLVRILTLIS